MPLEVEAEELGGGCPPRPSPRSSARRSPRGCTAAACPWSSAARAGRCSSGSWSTSSSAASPMACTGTSRASTTCWVEATPEQIERYVAPALRGEGGDAYAVTEAEAGSDPSGIASTAVAHRRRLADQRREVVRHLRRRRPGADRDGQRRSTAPTGCRPCSWSSPAPPGVEFVDDPQFTHNYPHGHPTIRFTDVEVARRCGDRRHRQRRRAAAPRGSPRSGWGSPPTGSGRCGGCSTRRPRGR